MNVTSLDIVGSRKLLGARCNELLVRVAAAQNQKEAIIGGELVCTSHSNFAHLRDSGHGPLIAPAHVQAREHTSIQSNGVHATTKASLLRKTNIPQQRDRERE